MASKKVASSLSLLSVLTFASAGLAADFTGSWSGDVAHTSDDGTEESATVDVTLTQDAESITLAENFYGWTTTFQINGADLYLNGEQVGALTDDGLDLTFVFADDATCKQQYSLNVTTGNYLDYFYCEDGYFERLEGTLSQGALRVIAKHAAHTKR